MKQYYILQLEDYSAPAACSGRKMYIGKQESSEGVTVLKEKVIHSTGEDVFSYLNSYGCRYEIEMQGYTAHILLVSWNNKYAVCVFAKIERPQYRSEEPFEGVPDDFIPLDGRFWGYPGQIEKEEDEDGKFFLINQRAYIEKMFSNETEATDYFEKMTVPSFQGFFEDVFGDG